MSDSWTGRESSRRVQRRSREAVVISSSNPDSSCSPLPLSRRWHWASQQAISYLMQQGIENPNVLSLAAGFVDPLTLPIDEVRQSTADILGQLDTGRAALQYGTTAGSESLRKALLLHLAELEQTSVERLGISHEQLILTTGSQQLLSLVSEILVDPGDIVLVAAPTYFVYLGTLEGVGARVVSVPTDREGMLPQELDRLLAGFEASGELPRVKLIYVVSYYENPTGGSLAAERREAIVKLAKKWSRGQRICLLEDAAYRELQYDGPILPSLWSYDTERSHVILAQTFSKTFAPGLRTGYGIVPHDLVGPLCDRKGNEDFGSAHLTQSILARIMQGGVYLSHVEKLCRSYRRKRDAILSAIDRHLAHLKGVTWERPHGGLYVWMTLPSEIETGFQSPLFQRAVKHEQVMYVPGELFYAGPLENRPRSQMRLSFGILEDSQLEEAIRRLSLAIQAGL